MAELKQLAGILDFEVENTDDWSYLHTWDIDLTGYTFEAKVEHLDSDETTTILVEDIDLGNGKVNLSLTKAEIGALADSIHRWWIKWTVGGKTRKALKGKFTV